MLTQWHILLPLTDTVKPSLFMHVHSSPPSLDARLHRCHEDHSHYINNGWTFSRQTSYRILSYTIIDRPILHSYCTQLNDHTRPINIVIYLTNVKRTFQKQPTFLTSVEKFYYIVFL